MNSREVDVDKSDLKDLVAMRYLASFVAAKRDVIPTEDQRTNAILLCMCLGTIRKGIIPHFEPKPVVQNVAPPPGVPGMAGMDPKAIADPKVRAEYEPIESSSAASRPNCSC